MKKFSGGSTLIELLVALFVLAIGLLGVLAMQTTGLKSNQRAEFMTEAHMLASDMLNMIVAYDSFDNPSAGTFTNLTSANDLTEVDCSAGCSRSNQYLHDRYDWSEQLKTLLPSGYGTVTYDAAQSCSPLSSCGTKSVLAHKGQTVVEMQK